MNLGLIDFISKASSISANFISYQDSHVGFWTMIAAVGAVSAVFIARSQLNGINKTNEAEFILKFKNDFFTPETRKLIYLIENNLLLFKKNKTGGSFKVEIDKMDPEIKNFNKVSGGYTALLVDDLLLGHFEDLGYFEFKKLIGFDFIYQWFSNYILITMENKAVKEYIEWLEIESLKKEKGADDYEYFKYIYKKCKNREYIKRDKLSEALTKAIRDYKKWQNKHLEPKLQKLRKRERV
jgi:hypothetical protein